MQQKPLRLAISGTYSTGKSTTTEALSVATGIPRTHAKTSREILMDIVPGKQVQELSAMELVKLGLRRFEERVQNESVDGSFISDGSVVHEWVYGEARMRVGINPGASLPLRLVKTVVGAPVRRFYQQYMDVYGQLTKDRAKRLYDAYVHLPVEFDMESDGHRPVSEKFRRLSDDLLLASLEEMGLPYHVVGGSVAERLEKIVALFDLRLVMPLDEAIGIARSRVKAAIDVLHDDDRFHEARRRKSLRTRVAYALRY
ncbi:AAA family ATPase [Saccharothrix violaceirubra]|uniref:Nicotinamide riboside kinase n=1 Tax=Saccharothrix violaceirubra TaxID=413306 RepID=A0A7W7T527_9PSEU|nr:AAA family ATPase [Saccharothrix violaceirubra]MBB4965460.1 nicotinamide riboside kinase [Saccharothrix violaceirubra]